MDIILVLLPLFYVTRLYSASPSASYRPFFFSVLPPSLIRRIVLLTGSENTVGIKSEEKKGEISSGVFLQAVLKKTVLSQNIIFRFFPFRKILF